MKTTLPLLTLAAALLTGCAATVPVKGIVADQAIERAHTKAPAGEDCAPILSWFDDMNSINGRQRTIGGIHKGFDMAVKIGTVVITAAPGVVAYSGKTNAGGETIWVYHGADIMGNHVFSGYGHMSSRKVDKGDIVNRGQLIGRSGDTSSGIGSEGAHLHFAVSLHPKSDFVFEADKFEGLLVAVSPNLFLYPLVRSALPTEFPKFSTQQNYNDTDWNSNRRFRGLTFPINCAIPIETAAFDRYGRSAASN
jgi:murein DD-endopeptidase MepM/ murein hydrolase activator NlpD